jgi:hypothetical protein
VKINVKNAKGTHAEDVSEKAPVIKVEEEQP